MNLNFTRRSIGGGEMLRISGSAADDFTVRFEILCIHSSAHQSAEFVLFPLPVYHMLSFWWKHQTRQADNLRDGYYIDYVPHWQWNVVDINPIQSNHCCHSFGFPTTTIVNVLRHLWQKSFIINILCITYQLCFFVFVFVFVSINQRVYIKIYNRIYMQREKFPWRIIVLCFRTPYDYDPAALLTYLLTY